MASRTPASAEQAQAQAARADAARAKAEAQKAKAEASKAQAEINRQPALAPRKRDRAVAFELLPPLHTAADADAALAAITTAVSAGDLTPSEAADLFKLVDGFTRTLEATVFEERVARLERAVGWKRLGARSPSKRRRDGQPQLCNGADAGRADWKASHLALTARSVWPTRLPLPACTLFKL
jgi:hypothetical protein